MLLLALFILPVAGCGTNLNEVLFQAGNAATRTALDLWFTDFANAVAGSVDNQGDDGGDDGMTDPGTDPDPGAGGGEAPVGLTGDPTTGATVYADNGCAACHCADASGGCALSAPPLFNIGVERIFDILTGVVTHPVQVSLPDQELADLEAFFASDIAPAT